MKDILKSFIDKPFYDAGQQLFRHLGVQLESKTAQNLGIESIIKEPTKAIQKFIDTKPETYFLGKIDRDIFGYGTNRKYGNTDFEEAIQQGEKYKGILIFGLKFKNDILLNRSDLANLTRAFNVASKFIPVIVLIQYQDNLLSIAATERGDFKQSWRTGEKIGKVSLLKDIDLQNPHTGHVRILEDMKSDDFYSFEKLHSTWQEVFNIQKLNEEFYKRLFEWFEFAKEKINFNKKGNDTKEIYTIKIITRLIFIWFLKEKKLINAALFDYQSITKLLNSVDNQASTYYKGILETLFFDTVNEKIEDRFKNYDINKELLFKDFEQNAKPIFNQSPFVNGGLFDSHSAERSEKNQAICNLSIPNFLFFDTNSTIQKDKKGLIDILNSYKFTVVENTPVEEDVALDPELLGKIFENLLAAINPETKDAARKETGSYYTPREVVDYMVEESLIGYLENKIFNNIEEDDTLSQVQESAILYKTNTLFGDTSLTKKNPPKSKGYSSTKEIDNFRTNLKQLLTYTLTPDEVFVKKYQDEIINALEQLTILDPAVGSGAFPMGVLQKMTLLLQNIDSGNTRWLEIVLKRVPKHLRRTLQKKLKNENLDYIRKLGIIQNTIYGIDRLSTAVQISKLRFFISLVIEQKTNDNPDDNFGILPLPNLEFKFVTANSLVEVPELPYTPEELQNALDTFEELVQQYFSPDEQTEKEALKKELNAIIRNIYQIQFDNLTKLRQRVNKEKKRATRSKQKQFDETLQSYQDALDKWATYDNIFKDEMVEFFEPRYFFPALPNGKFDIVIGNPPYLRIQGIRKSDNEYADYLAKNYESATGSFDLYVIFVEKGLKLLNQNGILNYIMPIRWVNSSFGKGLRKIATDGNYMKKMISFEAHQVFNASTYTGLFWLQKNSSEFQYNQLNKDLAGAKELNDYLQHLSLDDFNTYKSEALTEDVWVLTNQRIGKVLKRLQQQKFTVQDVFNKIFQGIATSKDSVYFLMDSKLSEDKKFVTGYSKELEENVTVEISIVKPLLKGNQVHRYEYLTTKNYVIFPYWLKDGNATLMTEKEIKKNFPLGYKYLLKNEAVLKERERGRFDIDGEWFQFGRRQGISYGQIPKLICPDISLGGNYAYDIDGEFYDTTTLYGYIKYDYIDLSYPYLLGVLNSEVVWFFLKNTGTVLANDYFRFMPHYVKKIPIPNAPKAIQEKFEILVNYILFLKALDKKEDFDNSNNYYLAPYFGQIIDGMVYELYFEKELKENRLDVIQYVTDLEAIENMETADINFINKKLEIIKSVYKRLYDVHHPVRNNLLFMRNMEVIAIITNNKKDKITI